jgi:arylsulfatase
MDRRSFIALGSTALLKNGVGPAPGASDEQMAKEKPLPVAGPRKGTPGRPNILMLMADQFRVDCVGAYGNKAIKTPNLDRLAREGIRFQNAYTTVPSCTPARSALMTGLGPWRHGMLGMVPMATNLYPVEKGGAMAGAGYYSVSIGKNHYNPITNAHGYHHLVSDEHCSYWFHSDPANKAQSYEPRCDYESWFWSQMPDGDPHKTGLGWNDQPSKPFAYPEELHATHWTGTTAVRFLEQYERPEPFFLKVSFIRPHSPYDPPERFFKMYEKEELPKPQVGEWAAKYEPRSSERDDLWHGKLPEKEIQHSREGYYGSVSFVDEQIGHVLDALEKRGMMDDTLIVFFSDHGDMLGDQNMWRKTYAYEPSAHIPLLMRPAKEMKLGTPGQVVEELVEIRDMLPTFLDAAGAAIPESIDGKSLLGLVRDKGKGWRPYIDLEHNVCYDISNHWNGLTDAKWKYIFHAYTGEEQLFHLTDDPHELHDLAKAPEHEDELKLWRGRLVEHLSERGEKWVSGGKLMLRKESMMLSPNFPGYAPEEKVSGWR